MPPPPPPIVGRTTLHEGTFFPSYRILSNKPAAGLIFQSRNYGRVYWKGWFIREAGLLERIQYTLKFLMINWASIHI